MNESSPFSAGRSAKIISILLVIAAMYWARDLLIPFALAILISFLLHPVVVRLMRYRLPKTLAVVVAVGVSGIIVGAVGYVVTSQLIELTTDLPDYRDNLVGKIRSLKGQSSDTVAKISDAVEELKKELATSQPALETPGGQAVQPVPVKVVENGPDVMTLLASLTGVLFSPMGTAAVVFVLVIFLLLGAEDLRNRLIWLAGTRQISLTTTVLEDISSSIGRYLLFQFVVSVIHGVLMAIALMLIGVPNALLFGFVGGVLRYVPYIGPWLAAAMPVLLSIATSDGWTQPLIVAAALTAIESITNGVLEPWLYGNSTGTTSWGVVVTTVFWTWLWGPIGLILAVPMTTCLVVLGKYIPNLNVFTRMFGAGDALPVEGRFYQRLLSWDEAGAEGIVRRAMEQKSPAEVCDELLTPVLHTMKQDLQNGQIAEQQVSFAEQCVAQIDQFGEDLDDEPADRPTLLVIAGQNRVDDIAARTLARLVKLKGHTAAAVGSATLASEAVAHAIRARPLVIAVIQAQPVSAAHSMYIIKAIHKQMPGTRLLAVCLTEADAHEGLCERLVSAGARKVLSRFSEALGDVAEQVPLQRKTEEPLLTK